MTPKRLRPGWLAALAAAGGLAALAFAWLSANGAGGRAAPPPGGPPQQATEKRCTHPPPQALQALKRGDLRLVVVLTAFEPAAPAPGLVVSLSTGDDEASPRRHELARVAVHPPRAFTAGEPQRRQRFLVPLARHASLIADDQPLCIELGFDPAAGAAGGRLGFDIELVPVPLAE
jgi:hypothetical protein